MPRQSLELFAQELADELLTRDITEPSAVLRSLSDHDLQAAYDHILEQFALELLISAHENSDWHDGKLVIAGNRGNIHLLQAAFYAVKLDVQRRVSWASRWHMDEHALASSDKPD